MVVMLLLLLLLLLLLIVYTRAHGGAAVWGRRAGALDAGAASIGWMEWIG